MNPAHLQLVQQSAEARLRTLFQREDELLAELARVRAEQRQARNQYADEQPDGRLLIRPGLQALRKVLR